MSNIPGLGTIELQDDLLIVLHAVGIATVFVSWYLATPLATLIDALKQFLKQHPELPAETTRDLYAAKLAGAFASRL